MKKTFFSYNIGDVNSMQSPKALSSGNWDVTSTIMNCFSEEYIGEEAWMMTADGSTQLKVTLSYDGSDSKYQISAQTVQFYFYDGNDFFNDDNKELITDTDSFVGHYSSDYSEKEASVIITAPELYPYSSESNYSYYVVIKVKFKNGGTASVAKNIGVCRPGVLLLHGLNSNSCCFKSLKEYLVDSGDYFDSQIHTADYRSTSTSSFYSNTHENQVVKMGLSILSNNLFYAGIASTKYDLIGHSMGGILERLYNQEVDNQHTNKLITLNTPHYGAPLGNLYKDIIPILSYIPNNGVKAIILTLQIGLELFCNDDHNKVAVTDLAYNSSAIQNLNSSSILKLNGIPVYAVGTSLEFSESTMQTIAKYNAIIDEYAYLLAHIFMIEIPHNRYTYLFDNYIWGDGIVSVDSQKGGLTDFSSIFNGDYHYSFHTKAPDWIVIKNKLKSLLLSDPTSANFCMSGFKTNSKSIDARWRNQDNSSVYITNFADPLPTSFIKLNIESVEDEDFSHKIYLSHSDDMSTTMAYSILSDDEMIADYDKDIMYFDMSRFKGEVTVYAIGRTNYNSLVMDYKVINLSNDSGVIGINSDTDDFRTKMVGDNLTIFSREQYSSIEIYNATGKLLRRYYRNDLDTYSLCSLSGTLIIQIISNTKTYTTKLFK